MMMAEHRRAKISDQIRQAMDNSGLTRYRIAKDIGMNESALGKFYNGERGLSTKMLDRLGEYLDLEIVRRPQTKSSKKGG
jgi:plasmid maintenance system antidote protein VapI